MTTEIRVLLLAAFAVLVPTATAANLVVNPDFDAGLDGWTIEAPSGGQAVADTLVGFPTPPSAQLTGDGTTPGVGLNSSCIQIDDSSNVDLYVNAAGGSDGGVAIGITTYSDTDCVTVLSTIDSAGFRGGGIPITLTNVMLPTGTQSVEINLSAFSLGYGFAAFFDHIEFGPSGTVSPYINLNQEGLSGTWYSSLTSGQGMQFQFSPDDVTPGNGSLFGAWYTFDVTAGGTSSQRWFSIQSALDGDALTLPVNIYQNTGGNFAALPATSAVLVGSGTLAFNTCEIGSFAYTLNDGRSGTIYLQRLLSNVNCVGTLPPTNPPSDFGLSGAWYNRDTSGQGIFVEVNPSNAQIFLGWYAYASAGEASGAAGQRWFSAQSSYMRGSRMMDLTLFVSTGGVFDTSVGAYPVSTVPVGTATLTYLSCDSATFGYTFDSGDFAGTSGSIPLVRLGAAPMSCSFGN